METVCEVSAVPHQQLLVSGDGLHRVEVDAHAVLASGQVLLLLRVGWIHVAHPVTLLLIQAIYKVMEVSFCINLRKSKVLVIQHERLVTIILSRIIFTQFSTVLALETNRQTSGRR